MNGRNVLYGANVFFPIFSYKYCHNTTLDRFYQPPINSYNDVIRDGFSMGVPTKPVKIYLSV